MGQLALSMALEVTDEKIVAALTKTQRRALRDDVARIVMGWETVTIPWAYNAAALCWQAEDTPLLPAEAWRPDTDERQCAEVLEHMLGVGFALTLEITGENARATFTRGDGSGGGDASDRRTALLLAARAALE